MAEATATEAKQETRLEDSQAPSVEARPAELPEVAEKTVKVPSGQIDILLDAAMTVEAHLGQAELKISDVLQLGPGSVLKLDRRAGEPVDLYLRGVKFASGQLVVVGEQLGVRIKEILPAEGGEKGKANA
jgi:flagellar motor switch protein FliN/FliY